MLIFLCGADSYRRQRKLQEIVAQYVKKHGVYTVQSFDCEDDDAWSRLAAAATAPSLFGSAQLFIVRNYFPVPEKLEKQADAFLRAVLTVPYATFVVVADDIPKKKFAFVASAPALVQEFAMLAGLAFETFIKQEASRLHARLTPTLLQSLAFVYRGDSWGVVTELERFSLGGEIAVSQTSTTNVFASAGVLASGQSLDRALPLLERLLAREDSAYIFNCLAYHARGAQKLQFADYDVAVKSGRTLYDTALLDYLLC